MGAKVQSAFLGTVLYQVEMDADVLQNCIWCCSECRPISLDLHNGRSSAVSLHLCCTHGRTNVNFLDMFA